MASGRHWCRRALAPGLAGVILLGCVAPLPDGSLPDGSGPVVAQLTADSADIHVRHAGQTVPYSSGMPLYKGDDVRTGSGASAAIEFTDGNVVYLRSDTSVEVGSIRLFFGEIFNLVRRVGGGGSAVFTNDLAAAADATMFLVRSDARGTSVTVVEGIVRCRPSIGGRWTPAVVRPDQQLTATARARSSPTPVNARATAAWADQTARRLGRPPIGAQPQSPGTQPLSPGTQPQSPGTQPESPRTQPQSPGIQPDSPRVQPQPPRVQPQSPAVPPQPPRVQPLPPRIQPRSPDIR